MPEFHLDYQCPETVSFSDTKASLSTPADQACNFKASETPTFKSASPEPKTATPVLVGLDLESNKLDSFEKTSPQAPVSVLVERHEGRTATPCSVAPPSTWGFMQNGQTPLVPQRSFQVTPQSVQGPPKEGSKGFGSPISADDLANVGSTESDLKANTPKLQTPAQNFSAQIQPSNLQATPVETPQFQENSSPKIQTPPSCLRATPVETSQIEGKFSPKTQFPEEMVVLSEQKHAEIQMPVTAEPMSCDKAPETLPTLSPTPEVAVSEMALTNQNLSSQNLSTEGSITRQESLGLIDNESLPDSMQAELGSQISESESMKVTPVKAPMVGDEIHLPNSPMLGSSQISSIFPAHSHLSQEARNILTPAKQVDSNEITASPKVEQSSSFEAPRTASEEDNIAKKRLVNSNASLQDSIVAAPDQVRVTFQDISMATPMLTANLPSPNLIANSPILDKRAESQTPELLRLSDVEDTEMIDDEVMIEPSTATEVQLFALAKHFDSLELICES